MFDDKDGVAFVYEAVEDSEEGFDIFEMEAGRRLVEDKERLAGVAAGQFGSEFDALVFAAGEGRRRLAELDVS